MEDDWVMTESNQKNEGNQKDLNLTNIKNNHFQTIPNQEEEGLFFFFFSGFKI